MFRNDSWGTKLSVDVYKPFLPLRLGNGQTWIASRRRTDSGQCAEGNQCSRLARVAALPSASYCCVFKGRVTKSGPPGPQLAYVLRDPGQWSWELIFRNFTVCSGSSLFFGVLSEWQVVASMFVMLLVFLYSLYDKDQLFSWELIHFIIETMNDRDRTLARSGEVFSRAAVMSMRPAGCCRLSSGGWGPSWRPADETL